MNWRNLILTTSKEFIFRDIFCGKFYFPQKKILWKKIWDLKMRDSSFIPYTKKIHFILLKFKKIDSFFWKSFKIDSRKEDIYVSDTIFLTNHFILYITFLRDDILEKKTTVKCMKMIGMVKIYEQIHCYTDIQLL